MTFKAEFIVNTGQFQHVSFWIEAKDAVEFDKKLTSFNDELKARLGVFMAEIESHVKVAHNRAMAGVKGEEVDEKAVSGLLRRELKATELGVQAKGIEAAEADLVAVLSSPSAPEDVYNAAIDAVDMFAKMAEKQKAKAKPKPWEEKSSDDFWS